MFGVDGVRKIIEEAIDKSNIEARVNKVTEYTMLSGEQTILVFIDVKDHPYKTLKTIYNYLSQHYPEILDEITMLPSFESSVVEVDINE